MCVRWEGDQRRRREHPEDSARGGSPPAGPGPYNGWIEGLCWQGGKMKRRRRRGSHTFSREAESIGQKLIKAVETPPTARQQQGVCVCAVASQPCGCLFVSVLGKVWDVSGWWMGALREGSFNHCSLVKYTTVLPNCSAIMSGSDEWLQPMLTYSLHQCSEKLHLIIPRRDKRWDNTLRAYGNSLVCLQMQSYMNTFCMQNSFGMFFWLSFVPGLFTKITFAHPSSLDLSMLWLLWKVCHENAWFLTHCWPLFRTIDLSVTFLSPFVTQWLSGRADIQ